MPALIGGSLPLLAMTLALYYKQGKQNVDADSLSRIKWPEILKISDGDSISYVDPVVVKAALVGVSIPYGFMEIVAKSMNVVTPDSQSCFDSEMTQENWIYEQGKDPVINYIVQLLKQGNLLKVKPYRSGTVNSNTVNSKFHLILSFCEIFARFLSFHV